MTVPDWQRLLPVDQADLATATASTQRLADFVSEHPVAHVFGTHIEQKNLPYLDYGRDTIYQSDEAPLEITGAHVFELNEGFISLQGMLKVVAMPDFATTGRSAAIAYRLCRIPRHTRSDARLSLESCRRGKQPEARRWLRLC